MTEKKSNLGVILVLLIIMTVLFVVTITSMFVPIFRGLYSVIIPGLTVAVLGIPLLILGIRADIGKLIRIFIILAGASAISIALGSVIHNFLSAAIMHFVKGDFEEPVFFIISTIVAPLGFLTGAIGTFILYPRNRKSIS
jgi:hypothetical protein